MKEEEESTRLHDSLLDFNHISFTFNIKTASFGIGCIDTELFGLVETARANDDSEPLRAQIMNKRTSHKTSAENKHTLVARHDWGRE